MRMTSGVFLKLHWKFLDRNISSKEAAKCYSKKSKKLPTKLHVILYTFERNEQTLNLQ